MLILFQIRECLIPLFLFSVITTACHTVSPLAPPTTTGTASSFATATTAPETVPSPTFTSQPLTPIPSFTDPPQPPPLLFIHEGALVEQRGLRTTTVELLDAGAVLDSTVMDEFVLVLCEEGLQRVTLADGESKMLLKFHQPARSGSLLPVTDKRQILYSVAVDDSNAEFSVKSDVGLYDANNDTARLVMSYERSIWLLGVTADNSALYFVPLGQEPSFGRVLVASLSNGELLSDLSIKGEGSPTLAPNSRYMATFNRRSSSANELFTGVVTLYDLASQPPASREVLLPDQPSHTCSWHWSPDSRFLYLVLCQGDLYETPDKPAILALWRLEVESNSMTQLIAEPLESFVAANSEWLLLWHSDDHLAKLVHLATETIQAVTLPDIAMPPDPTNREPLLADKQWLLIFNEDKATLVHLPSGEHESFTLPVAAHVVAWR